MSKKSYSEKDMSDSEVEELIDEMYPDPVIVCGMKMSQGYILRHLDIPAFNAIAAENTKWQCDICDTIHDNEEDAKDCCQRYCDNCGDDLDDDNPNDLCDDCLDDETEEEE